jgi:Uma2 family endonuclease
MSAVLTPPETPTVPFVPTVPETLLAPAVAAEQRIVLHDVSWATYEQLLLNYQDKSSPRFTYDSGKLEIFMPSSAHEDLGDILRDFVYAVTEARDMDAKCLGHTTYKPLETNQGVEPDGCFYFRQAARMRGVTAIDLNLHPPPELVLEIDITSPSLDRFPIYAQLRVPEIWRYYQARMTIFLLTGAMYAEAPASVALPGVTASVLERFIAANRTLSRPAWLRELRVWARETA